MESTKNKSITVNKPNIIVYDNFDEYLVKNWQELYLKGANFNVSFEWCSIWFKYFNKNKKLHIVTIWDNEELKLLAPLYLEKGKLYLIGSLWDYFNEFDLLYDDEKYLHNFVDFLIKQNIDVCFRYLNSETAFSKVILQKYAQIGVKCLYQIKNTKPYLDMGVAEFKLKTRPEVRKSKNKAKSLYGEELAFDFNIEKREDLLNEFISLHKKRWNGGIFQKEDKLDAFIRDLYTQTNLTILSRLYLDKSDKTVAYCFNYFDSNKKLWLYQPANNFEYLTLGPGKAMIQFIIENAFALGIRKVDLGIGSQDYKYRFANKDCLVFDFITYNNNKIGYKFKRILDELIIKPVLNSSILRNFSGFLSHK